MFVDICATETDYRSFVFRFSEKQVARTTEKSLYQKTTITRADRVTDQIRAIKSRSAVDARHIIGKTESKAVPYFQKIRVQLFQFELPSLDKMSTRVVLYQIHTVLNAPRDSLEPL